MTGELAGAPAGAAPPLRLGDHLAFDFLNSEATPGTVRLDWLSDGAALVSWMEGVGLLDRAEAAAVRGRFAASELDEGAARARELRVWFHAFVTRHRGTDLSTQALDLAPIQQALGGDAAYSVVVRDDDGSLAIARRRRWDATAPLLAMLAEAMTEAVVFEDWRRVRACEGAGCTNHFLDRTKSNARRWCSMAICGNRAKVAAHRARRSPSG